MKNFINIFSAIAGFSFAQYYLTTLEVGTQWWALPVLAIATGLLGWLFIKLSSRFRVGNSLLAVGGNLLLLMTFLPLFSQYSFWVVFISFVLIAMPISFVTNKAFHPGDLIFVPALAALSAFSIQELSFPLLTPAILFISYVLVIFITIAYKERKNNNLDEGEEDDDENTTNSKIDIEI